MILFVNFIIRPGRCKHHSSQLFFDMSPVQLKRHFVQRTSFENTSSLGVHRYQVPSDYVLFGCVVCFFTAAVGHRDSKGKIILGGHVHHYDVLSSLFRHPLQQQV